MKKLILLLLLASLCYSIAVVNSLDGRDVVSAVYYAAVKGDKAVVITPGAALGAVYGKIGTGQDVLLVQSSKNPVFPGLASDLRNRGNNVQTLSSDDPVSTNLLLAGQSGARKFILVDPVYGYNTVAALAYAKLNSMYLIFTDKTNADAVVTLLQGKAPQDILLYGYVDNEVKNSLTGKGLAYREINSGDKFDDNLALAELYFTANPSKTQAILSDGNAFDDTISAGDDPIILISPLIPRATYDFVKNRAASGQLPVLLVVDKDYTQTAYNLKTSINKELGSEALHIFVKFGQGSRGGAAMGEVQFFPVRGPVLGLEISSVDYNTVTKELEVTYRNTGNALEYGKSTILIFTDNNYVATFGDEEPFTLVRGQTLGKKYSVSVEQGTITANVTTMFGLSRKSYENGIQRTVSAGRVDFVDLSLLNISGFSEDRSAGDLLVTFTNAGNTSIYLKPYAVMDVAGKSTRIDDEKTYRLAAGEGRIVRFPGMAKAGSTVVAGADYGSREAFLGKKVEKRYVPEAKGMDYTLLLGGVIVVLLLAVAYLLFGRGKGKAK